MVKNSQYYWMLGVPIIMTRSVFHPEMHRYKTAWYSIRPPVSTHDFVDVSSCEVWRLQRGPRASEASWGGSGCHGASVAIWGRSGVPGVGGR